VRAVRCVGVRFRRFEGVPVESTAATGQAALGGRQFAPRRNRPVASEELQPQSRRRRSAAKPPAEALKPHPATPREMRVRRSRLPLRSVQAEVRWVPLRLVRLQLVRLQLVRLQLVRLQLVQ